MSTGEWVTAPHTRRERVDETARFDRIGLEVIRGPDQGRTLESNERSVQVGAAPDNDLILSDSAVSRIHARIERRPLGWFVVDEGSRNGTFIGQTRIREARLDRGTVLSLGETVIAVQLLRTGDRPGPGFQLVGRSPRLVAVLDAIQRVAPSDVPVLITGETGTGKELAARAIHAQSRRAAGPFVVLDCGALPMQHLEDALFGLERGLFPSTHQAFLGPIESAHGGTLFLDELGDLSEELQPKLLKVLDRIETDRVRGHRPVASDVRVVAASNRHLEVLVQEGRFLRDLFLRAGVVKIEMPRLQDRLEDIPILAEAFFASHGRDLENARSPATSVSAEALALLAHRDFPGNVRELFNVLWGAAVFAKSSVIGVEDLATNAAPRDEPAARDKSELDYKRARARVLGTFERAFVAELIARNKNNVSRAAREAGIGRRHLHRLLDKHGFSGGGA